MATRQVLLTSLLRTLVNEWGVAEVNACLKDIASTAGRDEAFNSVDSRKLRSRRLLARDQIEQARLPEPQKEQLREVADRFDRKQFLPSNSDVREFLMMAGVRPRAIKDRSEAFKLLLEVISNLSSDKLEEFVFKARQYGPSQLGQLSDAISDVAASTTRHRGRKIPNY